MRKFNKIKLFTCYVTERLHRYVFDCLYIQDHKINFNERQIIKVYNLMFSSNKNFRKYLKYSKILIDRAYKLKKLSILNYLVFLWIRDKSFKRYS